MLRLGSVLLLCLTLSLSDSFSKEEQADNYKRAKARPVTKPKYVAKIVDAHNAERASQSKGKVHLYNMTWVTALAEEAAKAGKSACWRGYTYKPKALLKEKALGHNINIQWGKNRDGKKDGSIPSERTMIRRALRHWIVSEKKAYHVEDNTCLGRRDSGYCDHYKQVLWDATTEVGCAYASDCALKDTAFLVCMYQVAADYAGCGWKVYGRTCQEECLCHNTGEDFCGQDVKAACDGQLS